MSKSGEIEEWITARNMAYGHCFGSKSGEVEEWMTAGKMAQGHSLGS